MPWELRLGPVALVSNSRLRSYRAITRLAATLHQTLWFSDDYEKSRETIVAENNDIGAELGRLGYDPLETPAPRIPDE